MTDPKKDENLLRPLYRIFCDTILALCAVILLIVNLPETKVNGAISATLLPERPVKISRK